jgi:hypothetical protein
MRILNRIRQLCANALSEDNVALHEYPPEMQAALQGHIQLLVQRGLLIKENPPRIEEY